MNKNLGSKRTIKCSKFYVFVFVFLLVLAIAFAFFINKEKPVKDDTFNVSNLNENFKTPDPETLKAPDVYNNSNFIKLSKEDLLLLLSSNNTQARDMSIKSFTVGTTANAPMMESALGIATSDSDFSTTNVQVENIDEGDIVKTNGEKIFIAKNNKLIIINNVTAPLTEMYTLEVSKDTSDYRFPNEIIKTILLDNDLLYLVTTKYRNESKFDSSLLYPQTISIPTTVVTTYKILEDSLEKLSTIEIDGEYYQSRLKEGVVYLITNTYSFFYPNPVFLDDIILNPIKETKTTTTTTDRTIIMPKDGTPDNQNMYTITTIKYDDSSDSVIDSLDLLLDYSNVIYMSEKNLYIAHKENTFWSPWYRGYYTGNLDVFKSIYKEVYPTIEKEIEKNIDDPEKIKDILNDYFSSLDETEKEKTYENIVKATDKYYQELQKEREKTNISKIELKENGKLGKITTGQINGELLNQFSLDEDKEGYLRVAITYRDNEYKNNSGIFILDSSLNLFSSLESLAKEERIYSVRFMGDKVFLVTFKQIDPFFVIDLQDRKNPEVLGYLKIPGYSSYLHPISDTLILGVGQDTKENQWGGVNQSGVKLSLFDVSDYKHPEEKAVFKINTESSNTPVEYDHKAFLYISKNNLISLPVNENFYTKDSETSFYVLEITDDSIIEKEKLVHTKDYSNLLRSLYIGEELYTISNNHIVTYNFNTQDITKAEIS